MTILVLCTGNSCRSQMAHGYLNHYLGGQAQVYSAGVETHGVNPRAVQVMAEDGIDISHHTSNQVDAYSSISFDYVITVCDNARERCPYFPATVRLIHQNFTDPARATGTNDAILDSFRTTRDQIKAYCQTFASTIRPS